MLIGFYIIVSLAIGFMITGLIMGIRLRKIASGGAVGKVVKILIGLIVLFTLGYLTAPLMPMLPSEVNLVLVGVIYLFGAVYVVLVLWLVKKLVQRVIDELEL